MQAKISHVNKFTFETTIRSHVFFQDTQLATGGDNKGPTPKELLIAGVIGCAGMDVVSMLAKSQMKADTLTIEAKADPRKEHPRIFEGMDILFEATGSDAIQAELMKAVKLSLTKYCGVTAMISKVVPVRYTVVLNNRSIDQGVADFGL